MWLRSTFCWISLNAPRSAEYFIEDNKTAVGGMSCLRSEGEKKKYDPGYDDEGEGRKEQAG